MPLPHLAIAALLPGLLAVERKAFLQAGASRPLVAGALIGLSFGEPGVGLAIGAGLELFFLGAVNLGAVLSDNELFTAAAASSCGCALMGAADLPAPAVCALATLLALPAAKLGRTSDRLSERVNARIAAPREARLASAIARRNLAGLWMPALATAAVALAGSLIGSFVLPRLLAVAPPTLPDALPLAWAGFLLVAAASALRSIRFERAGLYGVSAALVIVGMQLAGLLVL